MLHKCLIHQPANHTNICAIKPWDNHQWTISSYMHIISSCVFNFQTMSHVSAIVLHCSLSSEWEGNCIDQLAVIEWIYFALMQNGYPERSSQACEMLCTGQGWLRGVSNKPLWSHLNLPYRWRQIEQQQEEQVFASLLQEHSRAVKWMLRGTGSEMCE